MGIVAVNPATGETLKTYDEMTPDVVAGIIEKSHEAFLHWRKRSFDERASLMRRAAEILRENVETYARLMTQEMGKPIAGGRAEAEKCAWVCDYYADQAETFLQAEAVETEASKSFVAFQPLGIVLAVCRGISLSGRSSGSLPRRSWRATREF